MEHRRSAHALYHPSCRWLIQLINECHACLLATTYQVQASDRRLAEDYAEIVHDGQAEVVRAQQLRRSIQEAAFREWEEMHQESVKMHEEAEKAKLEASEFLEQAKLEAEEMTDEAFEDAERLRDEAWDEAQEEIEREKALLFEERRGLAKLKRKFEKEKEEWGQTRNDNEERSARKRRMGEDGGKLCGA